MLRNIVFINRIKLVLQLDCGHWQNYSPNLKPKGGEALWCLECDKQAALQNMNKLKEATMDFAQIREIPFGPNKVNMEPEIPLIKSTTFSKIMNQMIEIHDSKNHDYTEKRWDENFLRMAVIGEWFNDPVHKTFAIMIGVKLARLAVLLNGKTPNNESIEDSGVDLANYAVLFAAYIKEESESKNKPFSELRNNMSLESQAKSRQMADEMSEEIKRKTREGK